MSGCLNIFKRELIINHKFKLWCKVKENMLFWLKMKRNGAQIQCSRCKQSYLKNWISPEILRRWLDLLLRWKILETYQSWLGLMSRRKINLWCYLSNSSPISSIFLLNKMFFWSTFLKFQSLLSPKKLKRISP